jgi:hypothetical protein
MAIPADAMVGAAIAPAAIIMPNSNALPFIPYSLLEVTLDPFEIDLIAPTGWAQDRLTGQRPSTHILLVFNLNSNINH